LKSEYLFDLWPKQTPLEQMSFNGLYSRSGFPDKKRKFSKENLRMNLDKPQRSQKFKSLQILAKKYKIQLRISSILVIILLEKKII